jgi:hypothetical protein
LINVDDLRNPLAAMGWTDETYQMVLQVSERRLCLGLPLCSFTFVYRAKIGGRMEESAVTEDSLQQSWAPGMLPDAASTQENGKSVNEAQLRGGSRGSGSGAQIYVLPSGSSSPHANAQIHQLPTHQQDYLCHRQSQSQSAGLGGAIGTNVLFGGNWGFAGTRVWVKRALEAVRTSEQARTEARG